MLSSLDKPDLQPMDEYLHHIKSIANSLVAIKSPIFDLDFIQYTLNGLGSEYDNFVDNLLFLPGGITFDEVRTPLLFHQCYISFVCAWEHRVVSHQDFVATTSGFASTTTGSASSNIINRSRGRNNKGNNHGNHNNQNNKG